MWNASLLQACGSKVSSYSCFVLWCPWRPFSPVCFHYLKFKFTLLQVWCLKAVINHSNSVWQSLSHPDAKRTHWISIMNCITQSDTWHTSCDDKRWLLLSVAAWVKVFPIVEKPNQTKEGSEFAFSIPDFWYQQLLLSAATAARVVCWLESRLILAMMKRVAW